METKAADHQETPTHDTNTAHWLSELTDTQVHDYYDSYLNNIKPSTNGWYVALCPFHEDSSPSFSFNNNGWWKCFACDNEGGGMLDFECRVKNIEPAQAEQNIRSLLHIPDVAKDKLAGIYSYTDEDGKILFQAVRKIGPDGKKKMLVRHPDPAKPGHYIWNLNGTRRVLYNLPDIITAQLVHICEGEKD